MIPNLHPLRIPAAGTHAAMATAMAAWPYGGVHGRGRVAVAVAVAAAVSVAGGGWGIMHRRRRDQRASPPPSHTARSTRIYDART